MRQRSLGLEWIDKNDYLQQRWAHEYLQEKGHIEPTRRASTHDYLLNVGITLEDSKAGQGLIVKMKNAWRQKKYRSPDKGRKACTFKLKTGVKKELSSLARKKRTNETSLLSALISDESQVHAGLKEELKQANDRHKAQLIDYRERINKYEQTNKTVMDLLKVSVAELCLFEIRLKDLAHLIQPITQDQQRRIDKRCRQIMVDAEAVVKGQSTLLPGEIFNHAIPVGDATHAPKEAATETESPFCSLKSSTNNQSSSTEHTFRIDSERLRRPEDHSEPSFVLVAAPHDPAVSNLADLCSKEFPEESNSDSLEKNTNNLESQSAPQRPPDSAATGITSRSTKITFQKKKHSVIRAPQSKVDED
jgi:hypothetical protein